MFINIIGNYDFNLLVKVVLVNMFLYSDAAIVYSGSMSKQVYMVEIITESNESDELLSVCKNTNMVGNYSRQHESTSESKNHKLFHLTLALLSSKPFNFHKTFLGTTSEQNHANQNEDKLSQAHLSHEASSSRNNS